MDEINKRFQQFREALIADVYKAVVEAGGKIEFRKREIELRFSSQIGYSDVLGAVRGISLTVEDNAVRFKYRVPCWSEDNCDYVEEESRASTETVDLSEMSADELYNILNAAIWTK